MHLMYLGNTDAQMSKVHSYNGSFAFCLLPSIEPLHESRAAVFLLSQTNASTFVDFISILRCFVDSSVHQLDR